MRLAFFEVRVFVHFGFPSAHGSCTPFFSGAVGDIGGSALENLGPTQDAVGAMIHIPERGRARAGSTGPKWELESIFPLADRTEGLWFEASSSNRHSRSRCNILQRQRPEAAAAAAAEAVCQKWD